MPFVFILLIGAVINAVLLVYTLQRATTITLKAFAGLLATMMWWALTYAAELLTFSLAGTIFWNKVEYLGIATIPVFWFVFAASYSHHTKWFNRRNLLLLSIVPTITILLAFTNEYHHLIWRQITLNHNAPLPLFQANYGTWFWIHTLFSYACLLGGIIVLIQWLWRAADLYRYQATILIIGVLAPVIGNIIYLAKVIPLAGLDITPLTFIIANILLFIGIFSFHLVDIIPIARHTIVDLITTVIIVVDIHNRIIDLNPAAVHLAGEPRGKLIGRPISAISWLPHPLAITLKEIAIKGHFYTASSTPLHNNKGQPLGSIITLNEITKQKKVEADLAEREALAEKQVIIAGAATPSVTPKQSLLKTLAAIVTTTNAEAGQLLLYNLDGNIEQQYCFPEAFLARYPELSQEALERIRDQQQPLLVQETSEEPWRSMFTGLSNTYHSAMVIPIYSSSFLIGLIVLGHREQGHFTTFHRQLLIQTSDYLSVLLHNAQILEAEHQITTRQALLYEILHTLTRQLDIDAVLKAAVRAIAQLTGWPSVAIIIPDLNEEKFVIRAFAGLLSTKHGWSIPLDKGVTGRVFRSGKTQNVPDVSSDPDYISTNPRLRSELAIPIWEHRPASNRKLLAILNLESEQIAAFQKEDVLLAESIADSIALAMENATLYQETRRRATQQAALNTIITAINQSSDLMTVMNTGLKQALAATNMPIGAIYRKREENDELLMEIGIGLPQEMKTEFYWHNWGEGITGQAAAENRVIAIGDIKKEMPPELAARAASYHIATQVSLPLQTAGKVTGVLNLNDNQPHHYTEAELDLLRAIADQLSLAMERARLFQTIAHERYTLQAMINANRDGILFVNNDFIITEINPAAIEMLNLPGQIQDWVGRSGIEMLFALRHSAPDAAKIAREEITYQRNGQEGSLRRELSIKGEPPRLLRYLSLPVQQGRSSLGRLIVLRDITEEHSLATMREDLTNMVVHDLRNPLTGIMGTLEAINQDPDIMGTQPGQEMTQLAQTSAQRMYTLINAILDINQLEQGQMPMTSEPLSLASVIESIVKEWQLTAEQHNITLENQVAPTLPMVLADKRLLERILQNLLGNAIKFTPPGGQVNITAQATGQSVATSIQDNGPGIKKELQGRLFEKFTPGPQAARGSGLGLAFCKIAVEAHSGRIWAESHPGQGTTITFTLPVYEPGKEDYS